MKGRSIWLTWATFLFVPNLPQFSFSAWLLLLPPLFARTKKIRPHWKKEKMKFHQRMRWRHDQSRQKKNEKKFSSESSLDPLALVSYIDKLYFFGFTWNVHEYIIPLILPDENSLLFQMKARRKNIERKKNLFCEKWNYNKAAHVVHIYSSLSRISECEWDDRVQLGWWHLVSPLLFFVTANHSILMGELCRCKIGRLRETERKRNGK